MTLWRLLLLLLLLVGDLRWRKSFGDSHEVLDGEDGRRAGVSISSCLWDNMAGMLSPGPRERGGGEEKDQRLFLPKKERRIAC